MFQPPHSADDMRRLREHGIELVIVGAWHGDDLGVNLNCWNDLELARESGLKTALYVVLDSPEKTDARAAVNRAKEACGELAWQHASFITIDVEITEVPIPEIHAAIDETRRLGKPPVIYSAYWFWNDRYGNPHELCDVPLWNAHYDGDNDFDFASQSYGCWTEAQVVGEQYEGTSRLAGLEVDRNIFKGSFIYAVEAVKPPLNIPCDDPATTGALKAQAGLAIPPECPLPLDANRDGQLTSVDGLLALQGFALPTNKKIRLGW